MIRRPSAYILIAFFGSMLVACSSQKEPAQRMLDDIGAALSAAGPDAVKYVPDQVNEVQTKLGALKASLDREDYKAVVTGAEPVLSEAQSLASAAAAKKAEMTEALNEQWSALAGVIPGYLISIQSRIDFLSKKANHKLAETVDIEAAKSGLAATTGLWSKSQGAFGNGNLDEAVTTAKDVKAKLDALAASMKMEPAAPAAVPPPPT
jgi:hypothetical protein